MANAENIIQSQRLVRVYKDQNYYWQPATELLKVSKKSYNQLMYEALRLFRGKRHSSISSPDLNKRLYPNPSYLMNRGKQGQCYSLMMQAKCKELLFYAELRRARNVASTAGFIRKQHEARIIKNNLMFQGFELRDQALLSDVKDYIKESKNRSQGTVLPPDEEQDI